MRRFLRVSEQCRGGCSKMIHIPRCAAWNGVGALGSERQIQMSRKVFHDRRRSGLKDAEELMLFLVGDQGQGEVELVVIAELADELVLGLVTILLGPEFVVGLRGDL